MEFWATIEAWLIAEGAWFGPLLALVLAALGFVRWLYFRKKPVQVTVANPEEIAPPVPKNMLQMDKNEFAAMTRKMRDDAVAERDKQHGADRAQLEDKIAELNRRLANPEEALAQQHAIIEDLRAKLKSSSNDPRFAAALEAFERGEYLNADDIFAEIEARNDLAVQESARAAYGRGEVAEAEVRWRDAADHYVKAAKRHETYDHLRKASEFLWRAGRYQEALSFSKSLVTYTQTHGPKEALANALNQKGVHLGAIGQFAEAETLYREALEIDRATIGEGHPDYATRLNNLAVAVQAQGRFEEAEELYREALEIDRATIGEGHPDYAIRLNNLAEVLRVQGRFGEAEALYREALEIGRAALGEGHPDYATHLNNLARVLQDQNRTEEARPLFVQALNIFQKTLPADHPYIEVTEAHIANLPPTPEDP